MIIRAATLAAGLTGAAGLSQFPEYSQQYVQRLGGAVDALEEVVRDFDASAAAAGLSRTEALAEFQGSEFLDRRRADMVRTITRAATLSEDLRVLEAAGPLARAYHAARMTDRDVAQATLQTYKPALPLTLEGLMFALLGFGLGAALAALLIRVLCTPFKGRTSLRITD